MRHWRAERVSDATIMNSMAHLRWWAARVGRANLVKAKADYGIGKRSHVSDGTKRRDPDAGKLALVKNRHVGMALRPAGGVQTALRRSHQIRARVIA